MNRFRFLFVVIAKMQNHYLDSKGFRKFTEMHLGLLRLQRKPLNHGM